MKKILIFSALLIVTLSSYSQTCQQDLIPKQEPNKRWSFDSCQVRTIAKHLNTLYYADSLIIIKDKQIDLQNKTITLDSLVINKLENSLENRDKVIKLHQDQIDYQYTREVKRHIGWGLLTMVLLGLLISK